VRSPPPRAGSRLDRLALVPNPGPEWPTVVAALIDGVDVVVTAVPGPVSASIAGRLAARARQRGSVLMPFGRWDGADVTLQVVRGRWDGLGAGHGRCAAARSPSPRAAAARRPGRGRSPCGCPVSSPGCQPSAILSWVDG
jgi:hypothetical protein